MSPQITHSRQAQPTGLGASDGFDLDVTLVEVGDTAGLVSLTDDGCGETCGACTTNVA
ncbi:FxLD family lanthipeptide [Streptomyces sp. PTM05]|uniref:FxLD family lanthipeptide n=1 Tax=Streptantibioticus parmotrematis TaxID=2873249 RepID=A0ABS7R2Q6_9ACTN|nr:FxLD family lanthipeptide [Streptantibioticus parmotrematis]MBY8889216.1 FxLD family lanthipeptide [Streptantibioticus parmotrematis]